MNLQQFFFLVKSVTLHISNQPQQKYIRLNLLAKLRFI